MIPNCYFRRFKRNSEPFLSRTATSKPVISQRLSPACPQRPEFGFRRIGSYAAICALLGASLSACRPTEPKYPPQPGTHRDTRIVHEPCGAELGGVQRLDANADGKADITVVVSGGREVCRGFDFNFDGRVDSWVYLDVHGAVRRRESDYDWDGRIDEIQLLSAGQLRERQQASTAARRLDTWHFYGQGRLLRSERDANLDGVMDQWWEYPQPAHPECALVHSDLNGDGRPDPGSSVNLCEQGSARK